MTKRVFIVHGWDFNPTMNWYPWLTQELEKNGFEVIIPQMPDTSVPVIDSWVYHLKKIVGNVDKDTYFVGHSIGCQTIMRFLAGLDGAPLIGGCVFVAAWVNLTNLEGEDVEAIARPWLTTPIDFIRVRTIVPSMHVFLSTNDPYGCLDENKMTFSEKLNAQISVLPNKGHFTQDDGVTQLPEALAALLALST